MITNIMQRYVVSQDMLMKQIFAVFALMLATNLQGQTMFGYADTQCVQFLREHDKASTTLAVKNWIFGYFSGRIRETSRNLQIVGDLNIPLYDLVHKECSKDPKLTVRQAADLVYVLIP